MAGASTVGALRIDLGMNSAAFEAGIAKAEKGLDNFAASAGRAGAAANLLAEQTQRAVMRTSHNARNLSYQLIDIGQSIPLAFQSPIYALQNLGFQIAQIGQLYMGQGGMRAALRDAVGQVATFARWLGPAAAGVGLVAGAFAGLTHEINETAEVQVQFGDVFQASVQLAAESIGSLLGPAIGQISVWMGQAWDFTVPILKAIGNGIVGTFVGAFESVKATWALFPAAIGDLVIQGVNGVIGAVEGMINGVSQAINGFIQQVNGAIQMIPEGLRGGWTGIGTIGDVTLGRVDNPNAGAAGAAASGIGGAFSDAFGTDFMGAAFDAISGRAQEIATTRAETDKLADSLTKGAGAAKGLGDSLGESLTMGSEKFGQFAGEASGLLGQIFDDSKELAIAQAVLSAGEGIARTMGQYPFPFNMGMAALHAAAAIAQISKIASTTKNSTSLPGGAPSASAAVPAGGQGAGQSIYLTIKGSGSVNVDEIWDQLTESAADGGGQNFIKLVRQN